MANPTEKPRFVSPLKVLRQVRDAGLGSAAKVTLAVTSSAPYSRVSSMLAKPGLVMTAIARRRTDRLMAFLLANANMPSRTDVLALSTRLAHIEMTLDDLSAAVDALRAAVNRSAPPAKRASSSNNNHARAVPATEG